ncbi:MAG: NAD(P)/FAD-dependent oxidoreductase [Eubacteriales bacterium]|nr:NAD(P)/FAD-dependent oxidoreductase [Eubacteriales bacterium]
MTVFVIGGGPAGMIAATNAAQNGHTVTLFEQNEKLGKKLYITGKGRCNVTNNAERDSFFLHVLRNPRFLYSAFSHFDNRALMDRLEHAGVPLKEERGGRVFPASDKSSDILRAWERMLREAGVTVRLNTRVEEILVCDGAVRGIRIGREEFPCKAVIVATGGISYPQTGSTGDGYRFAADTGHAIEPRFASLVPLETQEIWPRSLTGLTLKNVMLRAKRGNKEIFSELGELLFTHFGVSGPLVLSLSGVIAGEPEGTLLFIDLKPALSREQLDARILRDLQEGARQQVKTALHALLPARLLEVVLDLSQIDGTLPVGELPKTMRLRLVETLKSLPLTVCGARGLNEAVVTRGGVSVRDVNASTMESKRIRGLYFAGEVLDLDATTGGYNLQIAWSTGALAGDSIQEL